MQLKIIITGITGFIGSHVARLLINSGHYVIGVRHEKDTDLGKIADIIEQIKFYNTSELEKIFSDEVNIDAVVHLATAYGHDRNHNAVFSANVELPFKLMSLAIQYKVPHFVNTDTFSSSNASGNYDYLREYSLSKRQCLAWAELFAEQKILKVTNMKLFHVYGIADNANKFVSQIVSRCITNEPEIALTSGEQRRDFVYVTDVAAAYLVALIKPPASFMRYLDVGTGKTISVRNLVEKIHTKTNSASLLQFGCLAQRAGEFTEAVANPRELVALGWLPHYDTDAGLDEIIRISKNDY